MSSDKNIVWHDGKVACEDRCRNLGQRGLVVWLTGLSGSGKSTIAVEVERSLVAMGRTVYRLDGDNIRHGLNGDLGFSDEDRNENIRRITEVAALFLDAGLITLVCFIAPFRAMRQFARERIGSADFLEVYIRAGIETCRRRDPKGLYRKALAGEIRDFTGIDSPYEEPEDADIILDTESCGVDELAGELTDIILRRTVYGSRSEEHGNA
jgi:adenylyl-sulfate kinase